MAPACLVLDAIFLFFVLFWWGFGLFWFGCLFVCFVLFLVYNLAFISFENFSCYKPSLSKTLYTLHSECHFVLPQRASVNRSNYYLNYASVDT